MLGTCHTCLLEQAISVLTHITYSDIVINSHIQKPILSVWISYSNAELYYDIYRI